MMIANYWTPDFREFALKGNQLNRLQNIVLLLSLGLVQREVVVEKKVRQKQRHG